MVRKHLQSELNGKADAAAVKATAAREKGIEAADHAAVEPPDLEPLAADAMPRRGLASKADGTTTTKTSGITAARKAAPTPCQPTSKTAPPVFDVG